MSALLAGLKVVLVATRFPENTGMAARACANMGCPELCLVAPERLDPESSARLATSQGQPLLDSMQVCPDLSTALATSNLVIATTARTGRTGNWRQGIITPQTAAREVAESLARGERVSLVFGPEDKGLDNKAICHCQHLVRIPTDQDSSSLNLAQAVLLLLYECANAVREQNLRQAGQIRPDLAILAEPEEAAQTDDTARQSDLTPLAQGEPPATAVTAAESPVNKGQGRRLSQAEEERLLSCFRQMLLDLDVLHGDNPDYFFLPWKRLFWRANLTRRDHDALMGLTRQVKRLLGKLQEMDGRS